MILQEKFHGSCTIYLINRIKGFYKIRNFKRYYKYYRKRHEKFDSVFGSALKGGRKTGHGIMPQYTLNSLHYLFHYLKRQYLIRPYVYKKQVN